MSCNENHDSGTWTSMDHSIPRSIPVDNQENTAGSLIAYAVVCFVIVTVVSSLRFYVRLRLLRKPGIDDIALAITSVRASIVPTLRKGDIGGHTDPSSQFSTIAAVFVTTYGTCASPLQISALLVHSDPFEATRLGLGRHFDSLSTEQRSTFSKVRAPMIAEPSSSPRFVRGADLNHSSSSSQRWAITSASCSSNPHSYCNFGVSSRSRPSNGCVTSSWRFSLSGLLLASSESPLSAFQFPETGILENRFRPAISASGFGSAMASCTLSPTSSSSSCHCQC